jgi:putative transposase
MAMDHAALLEVLEAMKSAGVDERIRLAATTIYQALIDAELTSVIGAGPWERTPGADGAAERLPTSGAVDPGR